MKVKIVQQHKNQSTLRFEDTVNRAIELILEKVDDDYMILDTKYTTVEHDENDFGDKSNIIHTAFIEYDVKP